MDLIDLEAWLPILKSVLDWKHPLFLVAGLAAGSAQVAILATSPAMPLREMREFWEQGDGVPAGCFLVGCLPLLVLFGVGLLPVIIGLPYGLALWLLDDWSSHIVLMYAGHLLAIPIALPLGLFYQPIATLAGAAVEVTASLAAIRAALESAPDPDAEIESGE